MASNTDFADFVLDQLGGAKSLRAKRMFGGFGIYDGGLFFAIIVNDNLYFKVDEHSRSDFISAGSEPFSYTKATSGRTVVMSYWRVPVHVLENPEDSLSGPTAHAQSLFSALPRSAERSEAIQCIRSCE